jgi:hypothetical protein
MIVYQRNKERSEFLFILKYCILKEILKLKFARIGRRKDVDEIGHVGRMQLTLKMKIQIKKAKLLKK